MKYSVGEVAEMTKVSVRTLQYYDEIGLLKPAKKTEGGNRLYGHHEIVKLQQIVALKFMGYSLETIKQMLGSMNQTWEQSLQQQLAHTLQEQQRLDQIEKTIRAILQSMALEEQLNWDIVHQLMNLYQGNQDSVKRYLDERFTEEEQSVLAQLPHMGEDDPRVQQWIELIKKVKANADQDPSSEIALALARQWMDQVNAMFGGNEELRDKSWAEIKNDASPLGSYPLEPDVIQFIEQAVAELYKKQT